MGRESVYLRAPLRPHNSSDADFTSLRHFIEEYSVADNDSQPLNPGGTKNYTVICTHCHYDHIGKLVKACLDAGLRLTISG